MKGDCEGWSPGGARLVPDKNQERDKIQAQEYRRVKGILLSRYAEIFPQYVWQDDETAIDLMAAEIKTLRIDVERYKSAYGNAIRVLDNGGYIDD